MFNEKIEPEKFENWKCIYETSIESEARLVQAYLQDQGHTCEVLSKKDSAYTVNFGDLSALFVYVPSDQADSAEAAVKDWKDGKTDYKGDGGDDPENVKDE